MLADAADMCLTGHERTMTFVELGCREHHLAIERILNAVLSSGMVLPVAIFDGLTRWLDGYVGSLEEPHLRTTVADVRAQQVPAGSIARPTGTAGRFTGRRPRLHAALASRDGGSHDPSTTARRRGPASHQRQLPAVLIGYIHPDAGRDVPGTSRRHQPIAPTASSSVRAKHVVALDNC